MAVAEASQPGAVRWPRRYWARQFLWAAVDLVFTPRCAGCGQPGQRLCAVCRSQFTRLPPPWCSRCGYPLVEGRTCAACRMPDQAPRALAGIRSAFFFEGPLQKAIHQFKYKRDAILADTLAGLMLSAGPQPRPAGCLVVPVPLAADRLAARGYNQSGLLARTYAEAHRLRLAPRGALRVRSTAPQVGLPPSERRRNVAGAFAGEQRFVTGRPVILVDDVCTTGATLDSCAAALLAAGATQVWGVTLARARLAADRMGS